MQACNEEKLLGHLGVVLYEYLGEEYPEVLGSILGALKSIVNVIGMTKMTPPIKDLLPRLTPVLKNRHEKASLPTAASCPAVCLHLQAAAASVSIGDHTGAALASCSSAAVQSWRGCYHQ